MKNLNENLIISLIANLKKRFSIILDTKNTLFDPLYLISTLLDPNTNKILTKLEVDDAIKHLLKIIKKPSSKEKSPDIIQTPEKKTKFDNCMMKLMNSNYKNRKNETTENKTSIVACVNYLLNNDYSPENKANVVSYWDNIKGNDWKELKNLALTFFSIPATSAPIERIYSQAGIATQKHRNKTKIELLNSQLMVYTNHKDTGKFRF